MEGCPRGGILTRLPCLKFGASLRGFSGCGSCNIAFGGMPGQGRLRTIKRVVSESSWSGSCRSFELLYGISDWPGRCRMRSGFLHRRRYKLPASIPLSVSTSVACTRSASPSIMMTMQGAFRMAPCCHSSSFPEDGGIKLRTSA